MAMLKPVVAGSKSPLLLGLLLSLAIGVAVWWQPLFLGRMNERPDAVTHLRWSYEFFRALQEHIVYPRWAFASHQGLGDPTFLYYQPFFYYVTAALSALGSSPERALVIGACIPYVLLSWVGYAHGAGSTRRALGAAALLATCPAVYFLTMNGGAFPWAVAIPFCILFVLESIKDRPDIARIALLIALVCLTHLLSGLLVLLCVGAARLVFAFPGKASWRSNLHWGAGVALGMALACFFIYPAISQQGLINPAGWTTDPTLDWHRGFAFPLYTWKKFGLQWLSFQWVFPLLALIFSGLTLLLMRWAPRDVRAWRLVVVALAALMFSSEIAYPLFALLPPLQKLQWAYRFVPLALALSSLAFAMIAFRTPGQPLWLRLVTVGLLAGYALLVVQIQLQVYRGGESLRKIDVALQGEFGQPEYLIARRGPNWQQYNEDGQLAGECLRLQAKCQVVLKKTHAMSVQVDAAAAIRLRLPLFAFPAWQVSVDGQQQSLGVDQGTGLIAVALDKGKHTIAVSWVGLPAQKIGNAISMGALAIFGLTLILGYRLRRARPTAGASATTVHKRAAANEARA